MDITTIKIGDRVMTNVAWCGVPIHTCAKVVEFYDLGAGQGVMLQWEHDPSLRDGFSKHEVERYLEWPRDEVRV